MPIGYGYQASGEEGYVNWAEAAKGFTDMLATENKRREDKKAAYDAEDRELANKLANPEYGQYKDGNDFISNYVDNMTKQRLIDSKLFKAGYLKEKDYVLKTNNAVDGTTTLFNLQKKYQEEYKGMMEGVNEGSLQAINIFNMSTIDGFADFSKTRAFLDPKSGQVKLAKLKMNPQKGIMEVTNDIVPVGTAMRNMSTRIATFYLDKNAERDAASLAPLKVDIERAATIAGAGSVTEYINSPSMFEAKFPEGKKAVEEFNKAINNHVEKYLAIPYNLTSILTQNTGKYGADSFTTDRALADKDKSKILVKIDPSTGLNTIDDTGSHYKEQRQEAFDYARNQIVSRLDKSKKIQTANGQLNDATLGARQFEYGKKQKEQGAKNLGENVGKFFTGSTNDQSDASNYLNKIGVSNYITEDADKNPIFNVMGPDDKYVQFAPKTPNEVRSAISSIMGYAKKYISETEIDETDAVNYARGFSKGKSVNKPGKKIGSEEAGPKSYTKDINSYVSSSLDSQIIPQEATKTAANLNSEFGALGFTFEANEDVYSGTTDDIIIYKKGQDTSKEKGVTFSVDDKSQVEKIMNWLTQNANPTEAETFFKNNPDKQAKEEPKPAPAPAPAPGTKTPAPRPGGG